MKLRYEQMILFVRLNSRKLVADYHYITEVTFFTTRPFKVQFTALITRQV